MNALAAIPHERSGGDEAIRCCREGRNGRTGGEDQETCQEHPLTAEPITQTSSHQQESSEDDGIGVDNPLQFARRGLHGADDGG
jgi:hypothetical protein